MSPPCAMPPRRKATRCRAIRSILAASRFVSRRERCRLSLRHARACRRSNPRLDVRYAASTWMAASLRPADDECEARANKNKRTIPHAASARHVLRARQHRADRRLARSGENPGPAVVDAAQERISGQALSDQSELRRYRRAEMLSLDRRGRAADRSRHRHHSGARGARRARAMRRRRRQERGDHLVGICRGGRRQRRDAGRDRRARQAAPACGFPVPMRKGFYSEVQRVAATFSPTVDVKPG